MEELELPELPRYSENKIFNYLKEVTDVASLSPKERARYERDLKRYRDAYSLDVTYEHILEKSKTARAEGLAEGLAKGRAEGVAEGRAEGVAEGLAKGRAEGLAEGVEEGEMKKAFAVAKGLKEMNLSLIDISRVTGLSIKEIEDIDLN